MHQLQLFDDGPTRIDSRANRLEILLRTPVWSRFRARTVVRAHRFRDIETGHSRAEALLEIQPAKLPIRHDGQPKRYLLRNDVAHGGVLGLPHVLSTCFSTLIPLDD